MSGGELTADQIRALLHELSRLLRRLNNTNADDAVDLAYNKYGDHSIPLAAGRENYLIVVDDALDAATTLKPNEKSPRPALQKASRIMCS